MPVSARTAFFRTRRLSCVALFFFALALALPTQSQASEQIDFASVVDQVLDDAIIPMHANFENSARALRAPVETLCAAPSPNHLDEARAIFGQVVDSWSRVEMFRFGPARENNRFEKLFYWPDRKGRGLKQVQRLLATEDSTATAADTLSQKSVAMQGLPAMEFVLFGTGSETLATGAPYRCQYALALSGVIAAHAQDLHNGWADANGYGDLMRRAGDTDSPYRSHGEAVQDILRAASEQLQIIRDLKIAASIGEALEKAKPKRAPFWRSGHTMDNMTSNLVGVASVLDAGIVDALPEAASRHASGYAFEMGLATKTFAGLDRDFISVASSAEGHQKLSYLLIPLAGAIQIVADRMPAALGLTLGFNSLDGD